MHAERSTFMNKTLITTLTMVLIFTMSAPAQDPGPRKSGSAPTGSAPPGLSGGVPRGGPSGATGVPSGPTGGGGQSTPVGGPAGMPGMGASGGMTAEKDIKTMTLEELLAKGLKDNPDIHVAES